MSLNQLHRNLRSVVGLALAAPLGLLGCALEAETPAPEESLASDDSATQEIKLPEGVTVKGTSMQPANFVKWITIGTGTWGSWLPIATTHTFCPNGSFAYGASIQSEAPQGSGDDTAMNGLRLLCVNPITGLGDVAEYSNRFGQFQSWGFSTDFINNPFIGGQMIIEAPAGGSADDTAANYVVMRTKDGANVTPDHLTGWGSPGSFALCSAGQAVCGFQVRVEAYMGEGEDDTMLNGIKLACCTFP